jgi:isopentenyldiphosphate isomerase
MFVFKKAKPAMFNSEATSSNFKFRPNSKNEQEELELYIRSESELKNRHNLLADWAMNKEDYAAAWLLEDFSDVQDENGNPHSIANFSLPDKAKLIRKLRETDQKFDPWFASHCEAPEKKIKEVAADREMVEPGSMQVMQG